MKLRAGKPLWLARPPPALRRSRARRPAACDVAVVGGGVTGALVAHELLRAGLTVALIDKREPGGGSTAASTGLLLYQPDMSMRDIARRHGWRAARRAYQLGADAIEQLRRLVRRHGIRCGWRSRRTLYVASRSRDVRILRREFASMRAAGFSVEYLPSAALRRRFGLEFPAALLAGGVAEVDAYRLTRGLLQVCLKHAGFHLLPRMRVRSVRETATRVVVNCLRGQVRARFAVIATGYEVRPFVTTRLMQLHSTYVIASRPQRPGRLRPLRCLMWETARPYFYLRTTPDHRIVFGGEDVGFATPSRRDRALRAKTRALERLFAARFPGHAFEAEYAWTGAFADTRDGLPCIGPSAAGSRVLYALGYGGNGITYSQIAAGIIRDLCTGRQNRDAAIFAFDANGRRRRRHRGRRRSKRGARAGGGE